MDYNMQHKGGEATQPPPVGVPPPYIQGQREQVHVIRVPMSVTGLIEYIARGASILTTFIATVIIATSKQTRNEEMTMKFSKFSAFKYFLAANIIVLIYSIASLLISILMKSKPLIIRLSIAIVDIVAVSMLLTANGAACAISSQLEDVDNLFGNLIEYSICSNYKSFCSQIKASIALSMFAAIFYVVLIVRSLVIFAYKKT